MLNVSVLVPGEKTPRFASFRLDLSRLYKLYKRYKLYACPAPGLLAIDHFGEGLREQVHIAGPARRHVIAVADHPRGARVGAGVAEQAAGLRKWWAACCGTSMKSSLDASARVTSACT